MTPGPKSQLLAGIVVDTIPGPVSKIIKKAIDVPVQTQIMPLYCLEFFSVAKVHFHTDSS